MVEYTEGIVTASQGVPAEMRSRRVKSVDHAIDILQLLGGVSRGLGLTEIARKMTMSKAAVYHLLATLETRRFVARDLDTGRYRLDWGLYGLGTSVVNGVEVTRVARPYLDRLASETSEFILLAILDEDSVLYLDRGEAPSPFRVTANTGGRFPLHATASGKILLAFCADRAVYDRVLSHPLRAITHDTITDPERMRRELDRSRRRGFATCWQEGEVGLSSVAMPIRDHRRRVVAALTIVGMSTRLNHETVRGHLASLNSTVHAIEERLGYPPTGSDAGW